MGLIKLARCAFKRVELVSLRVAVNSTFLHVLVDEGEVEEVSEVVIVAAFWGDGVLFLKDLVLKLLDFFFILMYTLRFFISAESAAT